VCDENLTLESLKNITWNTWY